MPINRQVLPNLHRLQVKQKMVNNGSNGIVAKKIRRGAQQWLEV